MLLIYFLRKNNGRFSIFPNNKYVPTLFPLIVVLPYGTNPYFLLLFALSVLQWTFP